MSPRAAGLMLLLAWGGIAVKEPGYCMDQPAGMEAVEGEAITLPCQYSYPRNLGPLGDVITFWRAGQENTCGEIIYNNTLNFTHSNYTNRLSLVGDPEGNQTLSIQITDLRVSDSKRYCCRVHLLKPNSTDILQKWANQQGTRLKIRGSTRLRGYQPDSIPAMEGDSISIPCKYTYTEPLHSNQSVTIEWSNGTGPNCGNQFFQHPKSSNSGQDTSRIFLDMNPNANQIASLRLHHLGTRDSKHYCCRVRITGQKDNQQVWNRPYGTRLIIGNQSNRLGYNVVQPKEASVSVGETATILCRFTYPQDEAPYWVGVYWRIKLDLKEFIYHPDPQLIHASYRGRTQLIEDKGPLGSSTLRLHNVTSSDNQTFYCLVEFRFCRKGRNNIVPIVLEGNGTRLIVEGSRPPGGIYMALVFIGVGVLLVAIIALVARLFFNSRKKGRKSQGDDLRQKAPTQRSNETKSVASDLKAAQFIEEATPQVDSDNIVYASLNMDKSTKNAVKSPQEQETETVYAAVRASRQSK